jgi:hypothetical protein
MKTKTAKLIFFRADSFFFQSARQVSSNRDFAVEQIFRADGFRADDPSPKNLCQP